MNGSTILSDEEKCEMLIDANSPVRQEAFRKARFSSQEGSLDDYIGFLSDNIGTTPNRPVKRISDDFRL
jgi:hypothetical protein